MNSETLAPPDMTRFTEHKDDLVAFEASVIVALAVYILFIQWLYAKERREVSETNKQLAIALATLTEAVRNVKSK